MTSEAGDSPSLWIERNWVPHRHEMGWAAEKERVYRLRNQTGGISVC